MVQIKKRINTSNVTVDKVINNGKSVLVTSHSSDHAMTPEQFQGIITRIYGFLNQVLFDAICQGYIEHFVDNLNLDERLSRKPIMLLTTHNHRILHFDNFLDSYINDRGEINLSAIEKYQMNLSAYNSSLRRLDLLLNDHGSCDFKLYQHLCDDLKLKCERTIDGVVVSRVVDLKIGQFTITIKPVGKNHYVGMIDAKFNNFFKMLVLQQYKASNVYAKTVMMEKNGKVYLALK